MESTNNLKELYEDKDGLRKEEVAALSGPNEFAEFYSRLKQIKEFYKRLPNEVSCNHSGSTRVNYFIIILVNFPRGSSCYHR